MQIKNRQQWLAIIAITGLALLVLDRFVVSPLIRGYKARTARIAELRKSVAQGALLIEREQTIRDRWNGMRTNTLPVNMSAAENEVLRAFDRWKQDSRISVSSIKPQWNQSADDYLTLECRADAVGTIQALARFLYEVEKDPLALRVDAVEITSRDNDGQQLSLALQVSGLVLTQSP
jgi:hypothetical protein